MDMNMLEKMLSKKKESDMDPDYKKVKLGALKDLHGEMGKLIGGDIEGMKKVTVASPDKAGLMTGLEKAKDVVQGDKIGGDADEEDESAEESNMSVSELEAKIKELEALKSAKLQKE